VLVEKAKTATTAADYPAAREHVEAAVKLLLARAQDERDESWLLLLGDAGRAALDAQDPSTARAAWEPVYEARSRASPEGDAELCGARTNLAASLYGLGDVAGARKLLEQNYEIESRTLVDDDPVLQIVRQNLGAVRLESGDLTGARDLLEKALSVLTRTLPEDDPDLQGLRGNLAVLKEEMGDLRGGRELHESVLASFLRTRPPGHGDVQRARNNLAANFIDSGDLQAGRRLLETTLEELSRALPEDHIELLGARQGLAIVRMELGDLRGARSELERILEIGSRTLPEGNSLLQHVRLDLAVTVKGMGEFGLARTLEEKVLEVWKLEKSEDDPEIQLAQTNLACTLGLMGDTAGAGEMTERLFEVRSRTLPRDHPNVLLLRMNLAEFAWEIGDLEASRAIGEEVLALYEASGSEKNRLWRNTRSMLAKTIASGALRRATSGADGSGGAFAPDAARRRCTELVQAEARSSIRAAHLAQIGGSSREAEERCAHELASSDSLVSFAEGFGAFERSPELEQAAFSVVESLRGATVVAGMFARGLAVGPPSAAKREELRRASEDLAVLVRKGATTEAFDRARRRRDEAERDLAAAGQDPEVAIRACPEIDAASVAAKLGERDAVIAFHRHQRTRVREETRTDSTGHPAIVEARDDRLIAFVVRRPATPSGDARLELRDLGPFEPVERAVRAWRDAVGVGPGRGIGALRKGDRDEVGRAGDELRRLVFDPLVPSLSGIERLVVVPDDVLHLVPLDALPVDSSSPDVLGDRWRIETRTTLVELLLSRPPLPGAGAFVGIGGVGYDDEPASGAEPVAASRGASLASFEPLPATLAEVEGIQTSFAKAFAGSAAPRLLTGAEATKERLFELAPSTRWLHVATHGWFEVDSVPSWQDAEPLDAKSGIGLRESGKEQMRGLTPMLLCGLALSGANLPEGVAGRVSGIATAEELATLDLTNCELAVLSACDTSVGERRAGLGVASLQRALQMAGARSVITSLWKVPDEATKELMLEFYRRLWIEKEPKAGALAGAKRKLREAKDEKGRPKYATRDWAAWTLTGEPD
jgi:CHAT domain-containing protein/tetratricopeptide (TPR) repeat protein